jgi:hypothetical protein
MPGPEVTGGKRPVPVGTPAAGRDPTPGGAPCKRQRPVDRPDPAAGQQEEAVAGQRDGSSSGSDSDSSSDSDSDSSSDSSSDSDSGGKQTVAPDDIIRGLRARVVSLECEIRSLHDVNRKVSNMPQQI